MIFFYFLKQVLNSIIHRQDVSNLPSVKGLKLYFSAEKSKKKRLIRFIVDIERLAKVWHSWPDCYFRMGMFMNNWQDFDQMKSFIPQDAYNRFAMDKDSRYHILIDDKILFHDILSYYNIPVPYRFFIYRNNEFRQGNCIVEDEFVDNILTAVDDNRIFVKKYTGGAASGISVIERKGSYYYDKDGSVVSARMIREKYNNQSIIFEKQIIQDYNLSKFNPDTVNTIRVLTYKNRIISATIRFGGKGEFVDNVSAHGVAVSIDVETGALGEYGLRMYSLEKYYEHPDSHIKFEGEYVKNWDEVKKIVEKSLRFLPYYNSVGFDIATTKEGPVVVEINTGAGVNLSQMGKSQGIGRFFE